MPTLARLDGGSRMTFFSSDSSLPPAGPSAPNRKATSLDGDAACDVDWLLDAGDAGPPDDGDEYWSLLEENAAATADLLLFFLSLSSAFFFLDLFDFSFFSFFGPLPPPPDP